MTKKNHKPDKLSAEEVLGKRVDAMMDPKLPDPPPAKPGSVPPLDIFKDAPAEVAKTTKTAPEVSGKLLKKVDAAPAEDQLKQANPKPVQASPAAAAKSTPSSIPQPTPPAQSEKRPAAEPPNAHDAAKAQAADLDDQATDQAVQDIASKEADTMLALQDAVGRKASRVAGSLAQKDRQSARRRRWAWLTLFILAIIILLFALPYTSYTCRWPVGIRLRVTTAILPSVCK